MSDNHIPEVGMNNQSTALPPRQRWLVVLRWWLRWGVHELLPPLGDVWAVDGAGKHRQAFDGSFRHGLWCRDFAFQGQD